MRSYVVFLLCAGIVPHAAADPADDPCIPYVDESCSGAEASGNYGCPLGEFQGVVAFSNGDWNGGGCGEYQCVEYVRRFYDAEVAHTLGTLTGGVAKNAYSSWSANSGLQQFENGSSNTPPQPGDILCFGEVPGYDHAGHVGIIKEVGLGYVIMIDQNRSPLLSENPIHLSLSTGAPFEVGSIGTAYDVQGWLRDPDYTLVTYACSHSHQLPTSLFVVAQYQPAWYLVAFINEGNSIWYSDPVTHPNDYVELKACDASGTVLHDGTSLLRHRTWKNEESPCTMQEESVAPGDTAIFLFIGEFSNPSTTTPERVYFRPNHSTGGLMQDWGEMHFQLDVRTSWFTTPAPLTANCLGTYDLRAHKWYESEFIATVSGWVPVTLPNHSWGCNNCDRFFRKWFEFEGAQSGQGVTIAFSSDDAIEIWVNGTKLGSWGAGCNASGCVNGGGGCNPNFDAPEIDITSYLHDGPNLIAAHVSEAGGGEYFNMTFTEQPLNITDQAVCCRGGGDCQEISGLYPSSACIADGGTIYVGDWFDCGTFSSCDSPQTKGRSDPTLHLQGPVPVPQGPGEATFQLIDTLPRTAWYDLPGIVGGGRIYVSDFTGFVHVAATASSDPDTLAIVVTDYTFDCPSMMLGSIQTGLNHVRIDTSLVQDTGFYCISTGILDVTVQTVLFNDLYPETNPVNSRNQIRGYLDSGTGVLSVGSEGYNALPGPVLLPGDVDDNGSVSSADIIYLVNHVFKSGPAPVPIWQAGDTNCNGTINSSDLILLVNYVFKSGLPPCDHF